jgi:hypothetical protein
MRLLGKKGEVRLRAVCMVTTPPIKKEMKIMIPKELKINSSISLRMRPFITLHFVGFLKISTSIRP